MGLNRETPARDAGYQFVQYLRKDITFADMAKTVSIGTLPAGAIILKPASGAQVTTAFNSATTAVLDIGTAADGDLYATDLHVKTAVAFLPLDEAVGFTVSADTEITAALAQTGTAATAGAATILIAYLPAN